MSPSCHNDGETKSLWYYAWYWTPSERRDLKVSMTERVIALGFTLIGAVLIGLSGYAFLKLILSLLLVLSGRE